MLYPMRSITRLCRLALQTIHCWKFVAGLCTASNSSYDKGWFVPMTLLRCALLLLQLP
jgi:hypothetical protein